MTKSRVTAIALLSTLALAGCTQGSLESELASTISASVGETFALSDLKEVRGSSFLVICPYESKRSVEDRLGFRWPEAPDYSQTDDRMTIAVIDDGRVVDSAELSRASIDFCSIDSWKVRSTDTELAVSVSRDPVHVTPVSP